MTDDGIASLLVRLRRQPTITHLDLCGCRLMTPHDETARLAEKMAGGRGSDTDSNSDIEDGGGEDGDGESAHRARREGKNGSSERDSALRQAEEDAA